MGFELPPGNPDSLDGAIKSLSAVGRDLHTKTGSVKSGFAAALSTWHGTRATDFRDASAGIQLQVTEAASALDELITRLQGYSKLLRTNTEAIKQLKVQADRRTASADTFAKSHATDDTAVDLEYQHASLFAADLAEQAEQLRADVRKAAASTAGFVDAATDTAVPNASTLSPAEIARRVTTSTGVAGIQAAMAKGTLTAEQAWGALRAPIAEVPKDAINSDGSINAEKLGQDLEKEVEKEEAENPVKKTVDTTLDFYTLGTAPSGAWSLVVLAKAYREYGKVQSELPPDLFKLTPKQLDTPPAGPAEDPMDVMDAIEQGQRFTKTDVDAAHSASELAEAQEGVGGLEKFKVVAKIGRGFDVLAAAGDLWTLGDKNSPVDDKVDAGVNLTGLGMTTKVGTKVVSSLLTTGAEDVALDGALETGGLLAADAAVGWVPVVGWGLVAVSAGYEVYKHWDTVVSVSKSVGSWIEHPKIPHFW